MASDRTWQEAYQFVQDAGGPALRLYTQEVAAKLPDGGHDELSPQLTLGEFYSQYFEPVVLISQRDAAPRNLEAYRGSLSYWRQFTGDPPLCLIDHFAVADFLSGLRELPGKSGGRLSPNTIRKHCTAIQMLLDFCGPPDRLQRANLGLLSRVPHITRPPRREKPAEDAFTVAEIELLIEHATAATRPGVLRGRSRLPISAACYWRSLYQFLYNTGLRIGCVMLLRREFLEDDPYAPGYQRLVIPASHAGKGRAGRVVPLSGHAMEALRLPLSCGQERIFCWPWSWPASARNLSREHAKITRCLPAARRFGFHAIRKLHANELGRVNFGAAAKSLGHRSAQTTLESYTSRRIIREGVSQLPQPQRPSRQLRLF